MNHSAEVATRIEATVPSLIGRIEGATALARLTDAGKAPERTPAGFVLFGEVVGGAVDFGTGWFTQHYAEAVTVVLFERAGDDRRGEKAGEKLTPLVTEVLEAVLGWSPSGPDRGEIGNVFTLGRAGFVGFVGHASVYEITFQLNERLRIN
jgi:hypothetical protein